MLTRIKSPKDLIAGAIFIVVGATFFIWAQQYRTGTATSMGPGYFPALLGIVLCLFGVGAVVKGVLAQTPDPLPDHKILPLIFLVAGVVSFGFLVERAGFVVASFVCLFLVCFQRWRTQPLEVFLLFVGLTTFNYLVFVYAFGMTMPMFWWN